MAWSACHDSPEYDERLWKDLETFVLAENPNLKPFTSSGRRMVHVGPGGGIRGKPWPVLELIRTLFVMQGGKPDKLQKALDQVLKEARENQQKLNAPGLADRIGLSENGYLLWTEVEYLRRVLGIQAGGG